MIKVGKTFPEFNLKALSSFKLSEIKNVDDAFSNINHDSYGGKWLVFIFYPKDFTFVCPTELSAFNDLIQDFKDRDAQILGCSTDSEFVHWAWRKHQSELRNLEYPLLSDIKRELGAELGILDDEEGVLQRATIIVDPQSVVRHISVNDLNVGRNPKETLRVLDALQTDELCPCNWKKGEEVIDLSKLASGDK